MIAFDCETDLFCPGLMAPPLVCLSWSDGRTVGLLNASGGLDYFRGKVSAGFELVGHNVAYDLAVLCAADSSLIPLVFKALQENRIHDTLLREQLLGIASGDMEGRRFNLAALTELHLGIRLNKGDERTSFAALKDLPISAWPPGHVEYAKADAAATYKVWEAQEKLRHPERWGDLLANEPRQVEAGFTLQLATCRGLRTEAAPVEALAKRLDAEEAEQVARFKALGVVRADGTKDMAKLKALVEKAYEGNPPRTDSGAVSTSSETLLQSGNPDLADLAGGGRAAKFKSTYLPHLKHGLTLPVTPSYSTLKVTGRTGSDKPNIQNFPTRGGLRPCFVPRPGYKFVDADYSSLELRTLAQSCLDVVGYSRLAEALNRGEELHCYLAGQIYQEDPAEILKAVKAGDAAAIDKRKLAKAGNFGLPGGMGIDRFRDWAKQAYKLDLPDEQARVVKAGFFKAWPEVLEMQAFIKELIGSAETGDIRLKRSGRVHGGKWFTELCNLLFQGPAADGAKAAVFETSRRCYTVKDSALYGSYIVLFAHDEIMLESPAHKAEAAKAELCEVMISEMRRVATPDVAIEVDAHVMDRWEE